MDLILFSEYRFLFRGSAYWSELGVDYDAIMNSYDSFEKIYVVARVKKNHDDQRPRRRVDGAKVVVWELSDYSGIFGFFKEYAINRGNIKKIMQHKAAVILRGCSPQNILVAMNLNLRKKKYGYEAVGDPRQVFDKRIMKGQLTVILRVFFYLAQKYLCMRACAVHYVTQKYLQNIYPASGPAKMFGYSDVRLQQNDYISSARRYEEGKKYSSLIFVGSLEQLYKGPHVLIRSIEICIRVRPDIKLEMVGGGRYLLQLKQMARTAGIESNVKYFGAISDRNEIRALLDKADLFVLPSYTEGLPRAMVEAMARGLPCIGTPVGGIVELLEEEWLIQPGNVEGLAKKILDSLGNARALTRASTHNLEKAAQYRIELANDKRKEFEKAIVECNEIH